MASTSIVKEEYEEEKPDLEITDTEYIPCSNDSVPALTPLDFVSCEDYTEEETEHKLNLDANDAGVQVNESCPDFLSGTVKVEKFDSEDANDAGAHVNESCTDPLSATVKVEKYDGEVKPLMSFEGDLDLLSHSGEAGTREAGSSPENDLEFWCGCSTNIFSSELHNKTIDTISQCQEQDPSKEHNIESGTPECYTATRTITQCEETLIAKSGNPVVSNNKNNVVNNSQVNKDSNFKMTHDKNESERKTLLCGICPFRTSQRAELIAHFRNHAVKNTYSCDECDYISEFQHKLSKHKLTLSKEKPYSCDICSKMFSQKGHLNGHMRSHSEVSFKLYSCDICSQRFSQKYHLNKHILTHCKVTITAQ